MGRRLALLIATDAYGDPGLSRLRAPAQEAQRLADLLADSSVGRFEKPTVLTNRPKAEIEEAIEELLTGRLPDDLVVLYIAGHGLTNDSDRLYFAAVDTRLAKRESSAVRASYVRDLLDDSQARAKVVLLDCCYSGIFAAGAQGRASRRADVEQQVVGRGTCVLTSTTSLAYSYEGERFSDNGQPASPFTHAVIEGLRTGRADTDRDGIITPDNLHQYVHDAITQLAGADQRPMMKKVDAAGRIHLAYAPIHDDSDAGRSAGGRLALGELLDAPVFVPGRGLTCEAWEGTARLRVPVGRHEGTDQDATAVARLDGRGGNVAVIGKSGSGKTTLIRTLLTSLALTHTPGEAEFHLLEGSVNSLSGLRRLPHVRKIAAPHETALAESTVEDLLRLMTERQRLYRELDIESVEEFRTARDGGTLPAGSHPDVFLVIDSWGDFATEVPGVAWRAQRIANSGLHYGFHVVVTSRRWQALPEDLAPLIGTRYELALDDPATSVFDAALSAMLSTGRGLARGKPFRAALPVLEAHADPSVLKQNAIELLGNVRAAWEAATGQGPEAGEEREESGEPEAGGAGPEPGRPADVRRYEVQLADLLGLSSGDPVDPAALWRPHSMADRLRALIGVTEGAKALDLDFKAVKEGGFGPHLLCVGAPDFNRWELLSTIVLSLALTHSPEEVNFLLIDIKSDSVFQQMEALAHVSAVVTGVVDDKPLLDRVAAAISGELARRDELIRATGRYATAGDYEWARRQGAALEPLPALMIVVDDFEELLSLRPELIVSFVAVGRTGGSLGVHLVLASLHFKESELRRLTDLLSYRIALRMLSPAESRSAIGTPEAYQLSAERGFTYLSRPTAEPVIRFRAATTHRARRKGGSAPSFADEAIFGLKGGGRRGHRIWLPPLENPPTLDSLIPPDRRPANRLLIPVGIVDLPFEQRRAPLTADLAGPTGNVLIVGGALSGKTTMLQSFVAATALQNTPEQVQILGIDFGGGGLSALSGLPHVSAIATASEPELIRRIVNEAQHVVTTRRKLKKVPDDGLHDVVLAVDNWGLFRSAFEDLAKSLSILARVGADCGLHVVLTVSRWNDVTMLLREAMGTKLELRLDPAEVSWIDEGVAADIPLGRPGRGIDAGAHHFLAAVPRIDGRETADGLAAATEAMVRAVVTGNSGASAPRIRTLPELVTAGSLSGPPTKPGYLVGIDELDLAPVAYDFSKLKHMLVFGESGSGKTNLLRLLIREIARRHGTGEAQILVIDSRRGLLDVSESPCVVRYAFTQQAAEEIVRHVLQTVADRQPTPESTRSEFEDGPWWSGPEVFVLVDDYELIATESALPLEELTRVLPFALEAGVHLVLARTTIGAGTNKDRVTQMLLRNLDVGGIILSGSRSEGPLIDDVAPTKQPPGRGTLVLPGRPPQVIQVAWEPAGDQG